MLAKFIGSLETLQLSDLSVRERRTSLGNIGGGGRRRGYGRRGGGSKKTTENNRSGEDRRGG